LGSSSERLDAPVAVLDGAGRCCGMTTYMNIDAEHRPVEVG